MYFICINYQKKKLYWTQGNSPLCQTNDLSSISVHTLATHAQQGSFWGGSKRPSQQVAPLSPSAGSWAWACRMEQQLWLSIIDFTTENSCLSLQLAAAQKRSGLEACVLLYKCPFNYSNAMRHRKSCQSALASQLLVFTAARRTRRSRQLRSPQAEVLKITIVPAMEAVWILDGWRTWLLSKIALSRQQIQKLKKIFVYLSHFQFTSRRFKSAITCITRIATSQSSCHTFL